MEIQQPRPLSLLSIASTGGSGCTAAPQYDETDPLLSPPPSPFPADHMDEFYDARSEVSAGETVLYEYDDTSSIDLVGIQLACVEALERILPTADTDTEKVSEDDQKLSTALGELLEASYELETYLPTTACCSPVTPPLEAQSQQTPFLHLVNVLTAAQAAIAQRERYDLSHPPPPRLQTDGTSLSDANFHPTVVAFRKEIAWARVESLASAIVQLACEREPPIRALAVGALPPEYAQHVPNAAEAGKTPNARPPSYSEHGDHPVAADSVARTSALGDVKELPDTPEEKERSSPGPSQDELQTVTAAIERLGHVAPRLQDQCAPMRSMSTRARARQTQQVDARMRELESIWDKIEAAHGPRRYRGVDDDAAARARRQCRRRSGVHAELEETACQLRSPQAPNTPDQNLARARELRERDEFLMALLESSTSARLENQDVPLRTREEREESQIAEIIKRNNVGRLTAQELPIPLDEFLARKQAQRATLTPTLTVDTTNLEKQPELDVFLDAPETSSPVAREETPTATKPSRSKRPNFFHVLSRSSSSTKLKSLRDSQLPAGSPYTPGQPFGLPDEVLHPCDVASTSSLLSRKMASNRPSNEVPRLSTETKPLPPVRPLPPAPVEVDLDAIGYVCEHRENLNQITVAVYGGQLPDELELDIVTASDAVVTSKCDDNLRFNVTLPSPVPLDQVAPLHPADGCFETRIASLPTPSSALTLTTVITHALSAPHLRELAPRALCCANCDREIADFPSDIQFKDLPSEHWAEMLEAWMCHSDPAFTAHITAQTKDGFWPTPNTVLVGGSYLLVSGSDICDTTLHFSDPSPTEDWRSVTCPCSEVLGKQRTTGPGTGTIRFTKWSISLMRIGAIDHIRFPVEVFVVSDMLELCQAHASHRFVISDEGGDLRLAVWLFNPSMRISYRKPVASDHGYRRSLNGSPKTPRSMTSRTSQEQAGSLRAAKIMYRVLDGGGYEHLPGFGGQVEQLSYPSEVCANLQFALQQSSSVYPPPKRGFTAFDCGFLERV